ncbi:MAG TPA: LysR family transcriptional regulator, partial [Acidimicrobiales bacterium]
MSLQQLRMLREVANRNTIAAAADSLGYTSSAVSQQLSGLEKATGVAVLERVGRNVRLTDAGRELVRHADDLLAGMEAAQVAIERLSGEVRGVLH